MRRLARALARVERAERALRAAPPRLLPPGACLRCGRDHRRDPERMPDELLDALERGEDPAWRPTCPGQQLADAEHARRHLLTSAELRALAGPDLFDERRGPWPHESR